MHTGIIVERRAFTILGLSDQSDDALIYGLSADLLDDDKDGPGFVSILNAGSVFE